MYNLLHHTRIYNCLHEDEFSGSKHAENLKNKYINTLRKGLFKFFKSRLPEFLTILTL